MLVFLILPCNQCRFAAEYVLFSLSFVPLKANFHLSSQKMIYLFEQTHLAPTTDNLSDLYFPIFLAAALALSFIKHNILLRIVFHFHIAPFFLSFYPGGSHRDHHPLHLTLRLVPQNSRHPDSLQITLPMSLVLLQVRPLLQPLRRIHRASTCSDSTVSSVTGITSSFTKSIVPTSSA